MKNLYLTAGQALDVFNELKNTLNGTLTSENSEYNLALDSDFVKGNIQGIAFPEGMAHMQFDVIFSNDVMLSIESLRTSPILFAYCSEGFLKHSFGEQGDKKSLKKNYTGILKSTAAVNSILYFKKNIPIKFSIMGIDTNKITNETNDILIERLRNTFFNKKEDYLCVRFQNFKITEKIEELNAIFQKGTVRSLLKKRILETILGMEIVQHTDSFTQLSQVVHSLILKRIDEIKTISNLVISFSAQLFTVEFLTKKLGLLANKLQEGFKLRPTRTVRDFLIFMRIERQRI